MFWRSLGMMAWTLTACNPGTDPTTDDASSDDPATDASTDAVAALFDPDAVLRVDLVLTPEQWAAAQADMVDLLGEAGTGSLGGVPTDTDPAGGTGPADGTGPGGVDMSALTTACDGLAAGDACTATLGAMTLSGTCTDLAGALTCVPAGAGGPPADTGGAGLPTDPGQPTDTAIPGGAGGGVGGTSLTSRDPNYVEATLSLAGETFEHVAFRFKGNSSLTSSWAAGNRKMPFRVDLDHFADTWPEIDGQDIDGHKELSFGSNFQDDSQIRDAFVTERMREFGVPAAQWQFARVYVDVGDGPVYWGLYTLFEDPSDDPMLERYYGTDEIPVYKPEGTCATWACFDEASFEKKTLEDEADFSDIIAAIDALNADTDPDAWRAALEQRLDVDGFLRWLAMNTVIDNWDAYGQMAHNYYLYGDPENNGRLTWVTWDHNLSMGSSFGGGQTASVDAAATVFHADVDDSWPLIRRLLDDPDYLDRYTTFVAATVDGPLAAAETDARLQELHDLVAPWVVGETGEEIGSTTITSEAAFNSSVDDLVSHLAGRREMVADALGQ